MEYIWLSPFQWMRVDISSIYTTSALTFKLKSTELPKIQTILFAYKGKNRKLEKILNESHYVDKGNGIFQAYL